MAIKEVSDAPHHAKAVTEDQSGLLDPGEQRDYCPKLSPWDRLVLAIGRLLNIPRMSRGKVGAVPAVPKPILPQEVTTAIRSTDE